MKLSIIIAAYNSEKTIGDTLKSIKQQLREDVEVIVVNDGSEDSTEEIIKSYQDDIIQLLTIPNNGVSFARNIGLENAKGEYIWFIDSDDFIEDGAIDYLFDLLKIINADVVMANYSTLKGRKKTNIKIFNDEVHIYNSHDEVGECCKYLLKKTMFDSAIWKNVYRKNFIIENQIFFDKNLFMNEDGNWLYEMLIKSNSVVTVPYPIYIYNLGSSTSITKKKQTLSSYKCSNYVYSRWYNLFHSAFSSSDVNSLLRKRMANGYANSSVSIMSMPEGDKKLAIELFMKHINILKESDNLYGNLIKSGIIIGYTNSLKLANLVHSIMKAVKQ